MGESASLNTSKDWTQLRLDTTPLDLRKYLEKRRNEKSDYLTHMNELLALISEYWEANCHDDLLISAPWLVDFTTEHGSLIPAGHALAVSPNLCTRLLLRLDLLLSNCLIISTWRTQALADLKAWDHLYQWDLGPDPSAITITHIIRRQIECKNGVIHSLWGGLQESSANYAKHTGYQLFSTKVAEFCLEAGCPAVTYHPSKDIYSLRNHLVSNESATREAELRKEIEELRNLNRSQQRIITNLAFRHLLEVLPARSAKPTSATTTWNAFFQTALKEAQEQHERGQMGHPFIPVLKKYRRVKHIENVGTSLYNTLSTNIHHFSGQFKVHDDQWNMLEADILRALTPLAENETESGINWEMERLRYQRIES